MADSDSVGLPESPDARPSLPSRWIRTAGSLTARLSENGRQARDSLKGAGRAAVFPEVRPRGWRLFWAVNADREQAKPLLGAGEDKDVKDVKSITNYDLLRPEDGIGLRGGAVGRAQSAARLASEKTSFLGRSFLRPEELRDDFDMAAGFEEGDSTRSSPRHSVDVDDRGSVSSLDVDPFSDEHAVPKEVSQGLAADRMARAKNLLPVMEEKARDRAAHSNINEGLDRL
jgi:hypothetical protein